MLREIAREMDPVHPPDSLSELWGLYRRLDRDAEPSLGWIVERARHPGRRRVPMLDLNTWLMDVRVAGVEVNEKLVKPAVGERARELGAFMRSRGDLVELALLQEVWEPAQVKGLLEGWGSPAPASVAVGEGGSGATAATLRVVLSGGLSALLGETDKVTGDGLMMIGRGVQLERVGRLSFEHEGDLVEDGEFNEELLSEKGVLRATARIASPDGESMPLELFTTHLFAPGGGRGVRRGQIDELVAFVERDPTPGALRIVAGDFNIASGSAEFSYLATRMAALGLEDILAGPWGDPARGFASFQTSDADSGYLARTDEPLFADDDVVKDGAQRIDYCFVERPRPSGPPAPGARTHAFDLDFARPRRLRLQRPADARDVSRAPLISDHLGIALTFFLTPR